MSLLDIDRASPLRHLVRLADERGLVEHARFDAPRRDLGCCTDDNGRALIVICELAHDPSARWLASLALGFLEAAHDGAGCFRLRSEGERRWTDDPPSDDAGGRALHGLGTACALAPWPEIRQRARVLFDEASSFRSPHSRAAAHAVLGAAAVLRVTPHDPHATRLLEDAASRLPGPRDDPDFAWPEARLTYANALLPHALLVVGEHRADPDLRDRALRLLGWLVDHEMEDRRLSFTPVGGWGPGEPRPAFDQQPIEAWAMADACSYAYEVTRDPRWAEAVGAASAWFMGDNDVGVPLYDPRTGGGFDGLGRHGVNQNQGAESTLSFLGTMLGLVRVRRSRLRRAGTHRDRREARAPKLSSAR